MQAGGTAAAALSHAPAIDLRPLARSSNMYAVVLPGLSSPDNKTARLARGMAEALSGEEGGP
jgi:hypothetical protein